MTNRILKLSLPMIATLSLVGGCKSHNDEIGRAADMFPPSDEVSPMHAMADKQITAGARTDATLRPYHFNNAVLNSLGREKLDSIVKDEERSGTLVLYVDGPADTDADAKLTDSRRAVVKEYLVQSGLSEDAFRLETGFNPYNKVTVTSLKPPEGSAAAAAAAGPAPTASFSGSK